MKRAVEGGAPCQLGDQQLIKIAPQSGPDFEKCSLVMHAPKGPAGIILTHMCPPLPRHRALSMVGVSQNEPPCSPPPLPRLVLGG